MQLHPADTTSRAISLSSHLIATASPAIHLASQAIGLIPEASKIADAAEELTASADEVSGKARDAGDDELGGAADELRAAASKLAQSVAAFLERASEVAVTGTQLGSPAVRLASLASHLLTAVGGDPTSGSDAGSAAAGAARRSENAYLTASDVDRLLSQKLDQTLSEFRKEMEEFKKTPPASGEAESEYGSTRAETPPSGSE